ncbi:MAG TPA: S1 RNA-binding domain-containing protein [Candidatus Deferrimicrobiaceae bacterium]
MSPDQPVVGNVYPGVMKRINKGGYVVDIEGTDCFCPTSEMYPKVLPPQEMARMQRAPGVGYKVLYVRGGSPVVSRKAALLDEESARIRKAHGDGSTLEGIVHKVVRMGAIVELGGGMTGFLELPDYALGAAMKDKLRRGLRVAVKVTAIDGDGNVKLALR